MSGIFTVVAIVCREEEEVNAQEDVEADEQLEEVLRVEAGTEEVPETEDPIHFYGQVMKYITR